MNNVPLLVLELANSGKSKRPSGIREAYFSDPFENRETFLEFLKQLKHPNLNLNDSDSLTINLDEIKLLCETVEQIVFQLISKKEFSLNAITNLNESAKDCCWAHQLSQDGTYSDLFQSGTLAGIIASICVMELAKCDVTRIKTCNRIACGLYFYDTTRNRSARWHDENPCGWRTRSERRK
ncbi:MAG: zinc finger protein [Massilibacillus sp.]|jgi:predicted RNA-binding Zn ribbon-like protein|nr:zinc finger protein [Massilibacillus sp.]